MSLDPGTILTYLAERSVAGTLVLLVALAGWWLLRRRLRPGTTAAWFLVPLAVFALPVEGWLPSPWAGANPIERALVETVPAYGRLVAPAPVVLSGGLSDLGATGASAGDAGAAAEPRREATAAPAGSGLALPSLGQVLLALWAAVVAVLLARLLWTQLRVLGLLRRARRLPAGQVARVRAMVGRSSVRVLATDELGSPATWGLGRRTLVLPTGLAGRLGADELRWVVGHELAHLDRWDHLVDLGQRLVQIAFFFHPAVWFANRMVRVHRELACDEAALERCTPERRGAGARALLEVAAFASGLGRRDDHAMVSLLDDKTLLRNRIMNLTRPLPNRPTLAAALPAFALATLAALAPAQFTGLTASQDPDPRPTARPADRHAEDPAGGAVLDRADQRALARQAVDRGVAWLLANQAGDGGWHDVQEPLAGREPIAVYFDDVGSTALALQTLVRHAALWPTAPADLAGRDRATTRAVDFLLAGQDDEGSYGVAGSMERLISHPMAMEAVALAAGQLGAQGLGQERMDRCRASLERAVTFTEAARNPYGGWRYESPPIGDNGSMQTGRMLLGLVEAFAVGVHAAPQTFAGGYSWFEEVYDPETGRTGCLGRGDFAPRIWEHHAEFPHDKVELATAMHMILRTSRETLDVQAMTKGAGLLLAKPPVWSRAAGTTDLTYWMYGTRAMGVLGGLLAERWNDAALEALLPHQVRSGDDAGAWPGADAWSAPGLRTYTTAAASRTLLEILAQG